MQKGLLSTIDPNISLYTQVSTIATAAKGKPSAGIPKSEPVFPLPYDDDFEGLSLSLSLSLALIPCLYEYGLEGCTGSQETT